MVLSRSDLFEIVRNAAGDDIAMRELKFLGATTSISGQDLFIDTSASNTLVGKKIEIKDPADNTLWETGDVTYINNDQVRLSGALAGAFPSAGSFVFEVTEADMIDSTIADRVPASVFFIEKKFTSVD